MILSFFSVKKEALLWQLLLQYGSGLNSQAARGS
jgi:hypothetical protein